MHLVVPKNQPIAQRMIALEGIDGSGKSLLGRIMESKRINNTPVYVSSEPTRSPIGKLLRQFLHSNPPVFTSQTAAYLFAADRNEHLYGKDGILHHLRSDYVFVDRYLFSSLAYQGLKTDSRLVWELNASFPFPETLVYLDIPPEIACSRMHQERLSHEHFETRPVLEEIYRRYEAILEMVAHTRMKILRLDATQAPDKLVEIVINTLEDTET